MGRELPWSAVVSFPNSKAVITGPILQMAKLEPRAIFHGGGTRIKDRLLYP